MQGRAGAAGKRCAARRCGYTARSARCVAPAATNRTGGSHENRNHRRARRAEARSDDQGGRGPDLPDGRLRVRRHPARRGSLRPQGRGQHLHPDHEPDQRRARAASRRAGGRARLARRGLGHGGDQLLDPDHRRERRQHRLRVDPLRRHLQPVRAHLPATRHRGALRRLPPARRLRTADRRAHQGDLLRVDRQPAGQHHRLRAPGRDRAPPRHSADRRQHGAQPLPVPAVRARRRHRRALADQVPGRARQQHRRRDRRLRQVPLGRAQGAVPAPERARRVLPRRRLHRGAGAGRLHRPRPRRAAAQHGRRAGADERLPHPAGDRDAAAADGPHLPQRQAHRRAPEGAPEGQLGQLCGPARPPRPRAGREIPGRPRVGHRQLRHQGRARRRRALPGRAQALHPAGQHRRCALARLPPGVDHAPAAGAGGARARRREHRHGAAVGGHRAHRRPDRGRRPGAGRGLETESLSIMPAHHARRRPLVVANARHSPSYGCALRLDRTPSGALLGHARKTLSL